MLHRPPFSLFLYTTLFRSPSGSFKVRGALNAMLSLDPATRERGVIASSAGKHGLGLAYASAQLGTPATVVLPESAAPKRAELMRRFGATVIQDRKSTRLNSSHVAISYAVFRLTKTNTRPRPR